MANHWAIAVGINQYQFFQPLNFAQRDAQVLRQFLITEAGFAPERCLLLTESSPQALGRSTYPNRENIQGWIELLSQQFLQPGDQLWCFFSGYGTCIQGEDFLMPIDGDPKRLSTTGIPLQSLYTRLKTCPAEDLLVLLDINRSQSTLAGQGVGQQTVELASDSGIATVLSCRPDQFSRESPLLRHGLFTTALLEGLRHRQCATLGHLDRYLNQRLPELSRHCDRPIQQPVVVNPPEKRQHIILPVHPADLATWNRTDPSPATPGPDTPGTTSMTASNNGSSNGAASVPPWKPTPPPPPLGPTLSANEPGSTPPQPQPQAANSPVPAPEAEMDLPDDGFWQKVLLGSGALVLVLLVGVFSRNQSVFFAPPTPPQPERNGPIIASPAPSINALRVNPTPSRTGAANGGDRPTGKTTQPGSLPLVDPGPGDPPGTLQKPNPDPANGSVSRQGKRTPVDPALLSKNKGLLEQARRTARRNPTSASQLNRAIAQARVIKVGQPFYSQAQQEIDRWSQDILNLANQRNRQGMRQTAISAARLVPSDRPRLYAAAQQAINRWQRRP